MSEFEIQVSTRTGLDSFLKNDPVAKRRCARYGATLMITAC